MNIQKNNPQCIKCKKNPTYYTNDNTNYPQRCADCHLDNDKNIVEKECNSCHLLWFIKEGNELCNGCHDYSVKKVYKSKEIKIKNMLEANNIQYLFHDKIPDQSCFKYRPDFIIDKGAYIIVLEVDEFQHKSYACECEIARMANIHQDNGGVPVVFIRFNPDTYKNSTGNQIRSYSGRKKKLIDLLKSFDNVELIKEPLSAYYLFYDGYDGNPKRILMDYIDNKIQIID